jgi:hypothetical protein
MSVNLSKLKERQSNAKEGRGSGLEFFQVPAGENMIYVAYPYPGDELPFIEVPVHYEVGPNNNMVICLDSERNPLLKDERVLVYLEKRGIELSGECAVCKAAAEKKAKEVQSRYLWCVVPLKFRRPRKKWREADDADELKLYMCGYTVWDGIVDVFINNGDISDPNKAVLIRLVREGKGMRTKYTISADTDSVRSGGVQLSKPVRAMLREAIAEGSYGDLYKVVGNMIKSPDDVEELLDGVSMSTEEDDSSDDIPTCFGIDYEDGDESCKACDQAVACKKESLPGDEEEETETADDDDDDMVVGIYAKDATENEWYIDVDDNLWQAGKASKKGKQIWMFFENQKGEKLRLKGDDTVWPTEAPEPPKPPPKPKLAKKRKSKVSKKTASATEEVSDPELDALEDAIQKRKAKTAAKKKKKR